MINLLVVVPGFSSFHLENEHISDQKYAILRAKQEKAVAFVLSVLTRWGTQCGLTQSILKNKQALFAWVADERAQIRKRKLENTLRSLILN
jgi:hypothetical protein